MKVILKRDEFNELNKEYEVHHIEQDKYGNKRIYLNQHRWVAPSLVEKYIEGDIMKITIYELLGKMKDYEAPNKILFNDKIWTYNGYDYEAEDEWSLFDEYVLFDILNDEVTILETTIKIEKIDENKIQELGVVELYKPDKIEKSDRIEKIDLYTNARCGGNMTIQEKDYNWREITNKFNEIIDRLNGE